MPTVVDTLVQLGQDLRAVIASVLGLEGRIQQRFDAQSLSVNTTINNFNARPLFETVFVDPSIGSDASDGKTPAKPKRTLDSVMASLGAQGVSIVLFGDDVIRQRHNAYTNVFIVGAQYSNNGAGYINFQRSVSFLGTAVNSPSLTVGSFSAGIFFAAGSLFTANINILLPDVPAGLNHRAHIASSSFVNVQILSGTIVASGPSAAALFGSFNGGRSVVTFSSVTLGTNAAGHVFDGIAAGADPNSMWSYSTNLKSA